MENIEATKIESGITVNAAKKVKISKWEELIKNAKELGIKNDSAKVDVPSEWNAETKPEWELVNMDSNEIAAYAAPKPIRIIGRGVAQAKDSWDSFRKQNIYSDINDNKPELNDENVKTDDSFEEVYNDYDNNIYKELEDFGYSDDFAQAVEQTIDKPELTEEPKEDIPSTYTQDLSAVIKEATDRISTSSEEFENKYENENQDEEIENLVRKALEQKENKVEPVKENDSASINNLEINDLLKEITQISEANDHIKSNIATIESRNEKMLNTYHGIEKETKKYESETLKNAKELLTRTKEQQERLRMREEEVINEGRNIKSDWMAADEANLMAKKRNEQLLEMLNSSDFSQEEETTYKKVA